MTSFRSAGLILVPVLFFTITTSLQAQWRSAPVVTEAPVPSWAVPEVDLEAAARRAAVPVSSADRDEDADANSFGTTFLAATAGSVIGAGVGFYFGRDVFFEVTGCCGGREDPGLSSGIIGVAIGSTAGSILGAEIARSGESLGKSITGAIVGIGTGIVTAAVLNHADVPYAAVGYCLGQGFTTAISASSW